MIFKTNTGKLTIIGMAALGLLCLASCSPKTDPPTGASSPIASRTISPQATGVVSPSTSPKKEASPQAWELAIKGPARKICIARVIEPDALLGGVNSLCASLKSIEKGQKLSAADVAKVQNLSPGMVVVLKALEGQGAAAFNTAEAKALYSNTFGTAAAKKDNVRALQTALCVSRMSDIVDIKSEKKAISPAQSKCPVSGIAYVQKGDIYACSNCHQDQNSLKANSELSSLMQGVELFGMVNEALSKDYLELVTDNSSSSSAIKPGMQIADVNCVNPRALAYMSKLVGSKGVVYVVEYDKARLGLLRVVAESLKLTNVKVMSDVDFTNNVPTGSLDRLICIDRDMSLKGAEAHGLFFKTKQGGLIIVGDGIQRQWLGKYCISMPSAFRKEHYEGMGLALVEQKKVGFADGYAMVFANKDMRR